MYDNLQNHNYLKKYYAVLAHYNLSSLSLHFFVLKFMLKIIRDQGTIKFWKSGSVIIKLFNSLWKAPTCLI